MNESILVSIGIPTYNRPIECVEAIKSILEQTYQNIEIIISDNSENDFTKDKIYDLISSSSIVSKQIIYHKQEKNIGINPNFMFVLQKATGKYFMWHEDELRLDKNYINKAVDFLEKNNDYSLVAGSIVLLRGNIDYEVVSYNASSNFNIIRASYMWMTHNTSIFYSLTRKDIISKIGIHPLYADDRAVLSKIAYNGKIMILKNIKNIRRLEQSLSNNGDGYEKIFKTLDMKYRGRFLAQLTVPIYAYKSAFSNPFIKNIILKITCGCVFFLSSLTYVIFYQKIYLETIRNKNSSYNKLLTISRKIYYRLMFSSEYQYFANIDILCFNKMKKILKEIEENNKTYAIYGLGDFGKCLIVLSNHLKINTPTLVLDKNQNICFENYKPINPSDIEKYKNIDCIIIASKASKSRIKSTLINNGYNKKIIEI